MTRDEAIKDIEKNILPVVGGKSLRMAIDVLKQPEEVFEIGKPHPLKGYEFCIFKDAYGDDWVEIRKYPDPWRGEEHG